MVREISLALELFLRCDQACLDEGFIGGYWNKKPDECYCIKAFKRKEFLGQRLIPPVMIPSKVGDNDE